MPFVPAPLIAAARASGFDLAALSSTARYDATAPPELRLPAVGRDDALLLVFGNTRALWAPFLAALAADPALAAEPDPLDRWTERTFAALVAAHVAPRRHALRFTHDPPPRRLPFQRLADVAGLAQLGPAMLCVDPTLGPWLALRAALVVDAPAPPAPATPPARPCDACAARPCVPALDALVAAAPADPLAWVALRDACPLGRAHRYGPHQLGYHYAKDRAMLRPDP